MYISLQMVMKKPSKRSCTVCPKKDDDLYYDAPDESEQGDNKGLTTNKANNKANNKGNNKGNKNRNYKNRSNRNNNNNNKSSYNKSRFRNTNYVRAVNFYKLKTHRSAFPVPQVIKRPAPLKSYNQYYGLELVEISDPMNGDTFTNTLTGDKYLYNRGIWNMLPQPSTGSRAYYSEYENQLVSNPNEGDLMVHGNQISVYQNNQWHSFGTKRTTLPKPILPSSQELNIGIPRLSTNTFQLLSAFTGLQVEGTYISDTSILQSQMPSLTDEGTYQVPIYSHGYVSMRLLGKDIKEVNFQLSSWIKYTDASGNVFQTVICIADMQVFDESGTPITNYELSGDNITDLKQLHRTITTTSDQTQVKLYPTSTQPIHKITFKCKLLSFQLNNKENENFEKKENLKKTSENKEIENENENSLTNKENEKIENENSLTNNENEKIENENVEQINKENENVEFFAVQFNDIRRDIIYPLLEFKLVC